MKILVLDAMKHQDILKSKGDMFQQLIRNYLSTLGLSSDGSSAMLFNTDLIIVFNKSDLIDVKNYSSALDLPVPSCLISCTTEEGMECFLSLLLSKVQAM